ncbi:hypothetical protein [Flavobacterium sp. MK4S-17]|uniref:hypothetical protein n=1 Tax=Flavobacterium sp. MK4S-17 TaxID=2543737 RepID=UPI00135824DE|nr:hypothetical protein [Flavobacterium sp. MK4S-17]
MQVDYTELESKFDCACQEAVDSLATEYKSKYESGGPGKLEAFLELIQVEFEKVENNFISENKIKKDSEALKRIRAIAKNYAKRCVTDYSKLKK